MKMVASRVALVPAVLCVLAAWLFADRACADTTYFPIPSASTTRNDGNDFGLIVPIIVTDPDGELKYIHAPMLVHNSFLGMRGTYNVFKYDPGGRQTRFQASFTERIERKQIKESITPEILQRFRSEILFLTPMTEADYLHAMTSLSAQLPENQRFRFAELAIKSIPSAVEEGLGMRVFEEVYAAYCAEVYHRVAGDPVVLEEILTGIHP